MKQCPFCSYDNPDDSKFCNSCGKEIPILNASINCPNCDRINPSNVEFCSGCGQFLAKKPAAWKIILAIIIFIVVSLLIGYWVLSRVQAAVNAELWINSLSR